MEAPKYLVFSLMNKGLNAIAQCATKEEAKAQAEASGREFVQVVVYEICTIFADGESGD